MRRNCFKPVGLLVVSLVLTLLLAACSSATATPEPALVKLPTPVNADSMRSLSGAIIADGSSTVYPITNEAATLFNRYAPKVEIKVEFSGTTGGFRKFCEAGTDIQGASRPIKPTEANTCQANNVDFIELPVAFDGLAVVINPQNNWVDNLSVEELKKIWSDAAFKKITSWKQVRDSFPDKPLTLFGPGVDSGTHDYFIEAVLGSNTSIHTNSNRLLSQ